MGAATHVVSPIAFTLELHRCPREHIGSHRCSGAATTDSWPADVGSFVNRCFECHDFVVLIQQAADRPMAVPRPSTRGLLSALRLALSDAKFSLPAFLYEASDEPSAGLCFGVTAFPGTTWFETATLVLPAPTVACASGAVEATDTHLMRRAVVEVVRSRMCTRPAHPPGLPGAAVDLAANVDAASTSALRVDGATFFTRSFPCRRASVPVGAPAERTNVFHGPGRSTLWHCAAGRRHVAAVQLQCARKDEQLEHFDRALRLSWNQAAIRSSPRPAPSPSDYTFRLNLQWEEVVAASDIMEMLAIWLQRLLRLKRGGPDIAESDDTEPLQRGAVSISRSSSSINDASQSNTKQPTSPSGPTAVFGTPQRTVAQLAAGGRGGSRGGGAPPTPHVDPQRPSLRGDRGGFLRWERDWRQAAVTSLTRVPDQDRLSLNEHVILSIAAWAMRHSHLPLANVTSSWTDLINQLSAPCAAMSATANGFSVIKDAGRYPCIQQLFAVSAAWTKAFAAGTPPSGSLRGHPALRLSARTIVDVAVQSLFAAVLISAHQLLQELSDAQNTPSSHSRNSVAAVAHGDLVGRLGRLVSEEQPAAGVGMVAPHTYIAWVPLLGEVDATMAACRELQRIWSPIGQDWRALDQGAFPTSAGA
jgi:hypothetical protein